MKILMNSLGIALSTIGAYLVWRYIARLNFADEEGFSRGEGRLVVPSVTPEMIKKFKLEKLLSKIGFGLILAGGILQIISNYLADK